MNINELTIGEAKKIASIFASQSEQPHPYQIGEAYFIRTVTHYFTGRLVAVTNQELVLEEAAWVADTGRFSNALINGFDEVEPYHSEQLIVGRGAVIDASVIGIMLPRSQK